ncbi:hypothetical protein SDC9_14708 [bioreactor metagenome]|uniref:ATP synthase subunit I n=1 Tax=bioreactor metagenome TaxID=1076179 RepID=A0A644TPQ7_9ZZZZ
MQEFLIEVKHTLIGIGAWGIIVIGAMYYSGLLSLIPGFTVGLATSVVYYLLMCYRVKKSLELPAAKAVSSMRTGWLVRLSFVIIMLVLSVKLPQINLWAAVAGMFSWHAVLVFNTVILIVKNTVHKGRV